VIDLLVVYVLNVEEAPVTKVDLGCLVVVGDTVVFAGVVSFN
jgi:hypothetical protein